MNQNNMGNYEPDMRNLNYNPNIELSTPINNLPNDIDVSNFVKRVENNIDNLNLDKRSSYKSGGYEYQHQQLINQQNPVISYPETTENFQNSAGNNTDRVNKVGTIETMYGNNQNLNSASYPFIDYNSQKGLGISKDSEVVDSDGIKMMNQVNSYTSTCFSKIFKKDTLIIILIFTLITHRRVNKILMNFIPFINEPKYYTFFILIKGIIFCSLIKTFF